MRELFLIVVFILLGVFQFACLLLNSTAAIILALSPLPAQIILLYILAFKIKDIFSPPYLFMYLLFLSVFIKVVYLVFFDTGYSRRVSLDNRGLDILLGSIAIISIASIAFVLGYSINVFRKTLKRNRGPLISINSSLWLCVFVSISVVSTSALYLFLIKMDILTDVLQGNISAKRTHLATLNSDGRSSSFMYLRWLSQTVPQVVFLFVISYAVANKTKLTSLNKIFLVWMFCLGMLMSILTSTRHEAVAFVLMICLVWHYNRKHFTIKKFAIVCLLLLFFAGAAGQLRNNSNQENQYSSMLDTQSIVQRVIGGAYFVDVAKTSVIVDSIPADVNYFYGKTVYPILTAPIPRSYWNEKPTLGTGILVRDKVFHRPDHAGIPAGFIGELYMNFGHYGVIIGMFLLGVFMKLVYSLCIATTTDFRWRLVNILVLMSAMFGLLTTDISYGISHLARYLIPLALLMLFSFMAQPNSRTLTSSP